MPAPRPVVLQNLSGPDSCRQIRSAPRRSMGSARIAQLPSTVSLRVAPKVRISLVRRQHSFTGLRAEPCLRSRTPPSSPRSAPRVDTSRASAFPIHRRRGLPPAAAAVTSASGTSGSAVDVLGRRRSGSSPSSSKGAASRARRQRCLPACFLPDKAPSSPQSDDRSSELLFAGQSMALPFHSGSPLPPTMSQGFSAGRAATALALSSTAASLLLLLPVGLPGSPELAQAAPESVVERREGDIVSLSQDAAAFGEMIRNFDSLEGGPTVEISSDTDNIGFLSLDPPTTTATASFSDAVSDTTPQDVEQRIVPDEPRRPTPVRVEGEAPALTAESVSTSPLDDTCVPLTEELHAALAAVSPPSSPRRLSPAPAIYTPSTSQQDAASNGGSSAGLLVPVSAAAAAATFSAASPGAAALMETSVAAQALMSAVPAAKEAAVAVAEPVIVGAAAATEAVAATAAAAAASASAGLSAKLSLIFAQSLQHLGVGGVAGAVGATVVYPLDTVKTRMQAQTKPSKGSKEGEEGGEAPGEDAGLLISSQSGDRQVRVMRSEVPEPYKNEFDCMWRMVQEEGVTSLYSGLGAQLVGIAPEKAVKLTVNEVLLAILEALMPGTRIWMLELIAGGGGGACQVVFTNPVEAVKVRLQAQRPQRDLEPESEGSHSAGGDARAGVSRAGGEGHVGDGSAQGGGSVMASASGSGVSADRAGAKHHQHHHQHHPSTIEVVQELGLKGLYTGSLLTLARDIPSTALFFASYSYLTQPDQQERMLAAATCLSPFVYVFLAACVSSIPASVLVTPFDVVKTRMQIQHASGSSHASTPMEVAQQLVLAEGPMALFKGGMARALRVGPQLGITLMMYDWLCKNL